MDNQSLWKYLFLKVKELFSGDFQSVELSCFVGVKFLVAPWELNSKLFDIKPSKVCLIVDTMDEWSLEKQLSD